MRQPSRLVFVSPRFLFPADSGGKIRTTQILRGLRGGAFDVDLVMPATAAERRQFQSDIDGICSRLRTWQPRQRSAIVKAIRRTALLASRLPIPVASDADTQGSRAVRDALTPRPDVVVFDFPHSAVLAPPSLGVASVLFTHNIEAEIFKRHSSVARSWVMRAIWRNQYRKMLKFERETLLRFDGIVGSVLLVSVR